MAVADLRRGPLEGGKPTDEKIEDEGGSAVFLETDVSDEYSVRSTVQDAVEEFGEVDLLVNNAGVHHSASVTEETLEGFHEIIDVNLRGTFLMSKHVLRHMTEQGLEGDVVKIGSIAGLVGYGRSASYCASKGGIVELTREIALDYGGKGINVNAVDPGVIKTDMTEEMREDPETRGFMEQNTVAPRLGRPEDTASAVAFLASEQSDFIMGENLVVDGGWVAK